MPVDCKGQPVRVGSRVRVLTVAESLKERVGLEEWRDLQSMVGDVFEVYEVDEHGSAWVEKVWIESGGGSRSHSLALESHEMELA